MSQRRANEIDKVISIISDILVKKEAQQKEVNPVLWNKIKEIWAAFDRPSMPTVQLHFCSNMAPLVPNERARIIASLKPLRYISFYEHTIDTNL